jgi:uncharacterized phage-associated protein
MSDVPIIERPINSAIAVANWLITKNLDDRSNLTHLKLQKLLYFAQGLHLAYSGSPLFDDPIEAWRHGPVVRSIYNALGGQEKYDEITEPIKGVVVKDGMCTWGTPEIQSVTTAEFMESFWPVYSKATPWGLVKTSHAKGGPWDQIMSSAEGEALYNNPTIPVEIIKNYFEKQIKKVIQNA